MNFGHHPDPAIDFCHEVDEIEALVFDAVNGIRDCGSEASQRIRRAMDFRVGGDALSVEAKWRLYELEAVTQ
jgi:hypothetical protein